MEVDSDGDMEDIDEGPAISAREAMTLCEEIDKVCLQFPNVDNVSTLELQQQLQLMCGHLLDITSHKQVTLETYFKKLDT